MTIPLRLMVFTDLDGTLLDHDTYSWAAAQPALAALKDLSAAVVLASSKTAAEVGTLRAALGLQDWPAIVENGAGHLPPGVSSVQGGSGYADLRQILAGLPPDLRQNFRGFGDVTLAQLGEMTGLPPAGAQLAQQRDFSEPGQWLGTVQQQADFLTHLQAQGVSAQQGGRFLTLSFGGNKVDQLRKIVQRYAPQHTIALGDAPNDVQMLEATDFGVVVANPHRAPLAPLQGEAEGRIIRSTAAGSQGWNAAMLHFLDRLQLNKG